MSEMRRLISTRELMDDEREFLLCRLNGRHAPQDLEDVVFGKVRVPADGVARARVQRAHHGQAGFRVA